MSDQDDYEGSVDLMALLNDNEGDGSASSEDGSDGSEDSGITVRDQESFAEAEQFEPLSREDFEDGVSPEIQKTDEAEEVTLTQPEKSVEKAYEEPVIPTPTPAATVEVERTPLKVTEPEFIDQQTMTNATANYRPKIREHDDITIDSEDQGGLMQGSNTKAIPIDQYESQLAANNLAPREEPGEYVIAGFLIKMGPISQPVYTDGDDVESLEALMISPSKYLNILANGRTKVCDVITGAPVIAKGETIVSKYVDGKWVRE